MSKASEYAKLAGNTQPITAIGGTLYSVKPNGCLLIERPGNLDIAVPPHHVIELIKWLRETFED